MVILEWGICTVHRTQSFPNDGDGAERGEVGIRLTRAQAGGSVLTRRGSRHSGVVIRAGISGSVSLPEVSPGGEGTVNLFPQCGQRADLPARAGVAFRGRSQDAQGKRTGARGLTGMGSGS